MRYCVTGKSLICALLLAGCTERDSGDPGVVMSDSAGIVIVENPPPGAESSYAVSGPVVVIGEVDGVRDYLLHQVSGVVRLSDAGIAVATAGSEIRWYDAAGSFVRRSGGEGAGPGEFRSIRYMRALRGDSLLIFDSANRRVSVLSPDGALVRDEVLDRNDDGAVVVASALRDGTMLVRSTAPAPPVSTPLYRVEFEFAVSTRDTVRTLRVYPGPEAALHADGSGGGISSIFISVLPFARTAHAVAGPDHFFIGSSDELQIDVWNSEGTLVRIIRVAVQPRPVTEEVRQAYIEGEVASLRARAEERNQSFDEAGARRQLQAQRHAPALPAFAGLLATADGGLWVREFAMPGADTIGERWLIFDAEGRLSGTVQLPSRFTAMHIDGRAVLGVFRDSSDVPFIHVYAVSQ